MTITVKIEQKVKIKGVSAYVAETDVDIHTNTRTITKDSIQKLEVGKPVEISVHGTHTFTVFEKVDG